MVLISSFYENVARHDIEHRALQPDEKDENVILHFAPQPPTLMMVACLWDHWQSPGKPDLYSFAAITDEPPREEAARDTTAASFRLNMSTSRAGSNRRAKAPRSSMCHISR